MNKRLTHKVRFTFADTRFDTAHGYALGLCVKEARVWCADQGLSEGDDFGFYSESTRKPDRYLEWVFTFRDAQPATLFKIRFSCYL